MIEKLKALHKRWNDYMVGKNRSMFDSYKQLKFALGILGLLLPVIAIGGGLASPWREIQVSISHTYHTNLRDVLVGAIACLAIVFITHRGYGPVDNFVTTFIGIAAVGVALFPSPINANSPADNAVAAFIVGQTHGDPALIATAAGKLPLGILLIDPQYPASGLVHLICAGLFFIAVAVYLFFILTLSDKKKLDDAKKRKNLLYRICGAVIFACMTALIVIAAAAPDFLAQTHVGLIGETIMLVSFSIAWLVKAGPPKTWYQVQTGRGAKQLARKK